MFAVNKFKYSIDPYNPAVITLELTKRSRRNLRIRKVAKIVAFVAAVKATAEGKRKAEELMNEQNANQQHPNQS